MKRPEGFDSSSADARSNEASNTRPTKSDSPKQDSWKRDKAKRDKAKADAPKTDAPKADAPTSGRRGSRSTNTASKVSVPQEQKLRVAPSSPAQKPTADLPQNEARGSQARLRARARDRRRFERREVRRFTRRSRHRRLGWGIALSIVALVGGLLVVAVYSPLLALRTVTVDGNSKVGNDAIQGAIREQMGTPLALLDYESLKSKLDVYPLIRSFSTEIVPPSTLKIHIVERAPIGVVSSPAGFQVIDPAGVVLESVLRRPEGIPLLDLGGKGTDSVAFSSVVDVMLALPESIRSRVDIVQATSKDDVRLVLVDAGQRVKWGSSERSALKARVLQELIATQEPNARVEFDVSAPLSPVVRGG